MTRLRFIHFIAPIAIGSLAPLICMAQVPNNNAVNVQATAAAQSDGSVNEVVVTAQKRSERLIDVPISIAAVSSAELQARQITSLEDLTRIVPDLAENNYGANHYIEIRGVSNLVGNSPLVGIYLDEADVTLGGAAITQINPTVYDIERVEVLRGPQGTLYGEGSAGGTIRFVTRNPNLDHFEYGLDVAGLFTENGAPSAHVNAVVNMPIVEDVLAVRVVGTYEHDGGWIDQPTAGLKNINSEDLENLRVKALWQINPHFTASAMAVINSDHKGNNVTDVDNPRTFTQVFGQTTTPRVNSNYDLFNFTLAYDFGFAKLLNTTSYFVVKEPYYNQSQTFQYTPPGSQRYDYYAPYQNTNEHVVTDEVRMSSLGSGPLQWTFGGFFREYRDTTFIPLNYFDLPAGTALLYPYSFGVETLYKQASAFADVSYRLWDRLTIGVGVRDFNDHQDFADHVALTNQSASFSSVDPRVYAQYKFNPNFNVYASAAEGFRSGGFNAAQQPAYAPESVWTYELGAKSTLLQGRIAADVSLFWSDYTNYQTFGITNALTGENFIADVGSATIKGVEWDLTYHPIAHWRLDFRGDYLDSRFTSIKATDADYNVGDPLDLVPQYQFSMSAQYDYVLAGKSGFARLDYTQQGPEYYRNRSIGDFFVGKSDIIHTLDFSTMIDLSDRLRVGLFAQNLTNDQGFASPFYYIGSAVRPRPRTVGINFSVPLH